MTRWSIFTVSFLMACGPQLPVGWEKAQPVDAFTQADCEGSPYDGTHTEGFSWDGTSPVALQATEVHFRCAQSLEGFWQLDGTTLEVLIQPEDMRPSIVASCDCLYDIDLAVDDVAPEAVRVFRRWDLESGDSAPLELVDVDLL